MVSQKVLNDLFGAFPDAILNRNIEFVADPHRRVNSYFRLDNCRTRIETICKVLEYLSREACKSQHFNAKWRNDQVHDYHLKGINTFCGSKFSTEDIELVYAYLGNGVNRQKTLAFINSGYNLNILEERKSNAKTQ